MIDDVHDRNGPNTVWYIYNVWRVESRSSSYTGYNLYEVFDWLRDGRDGWCTDPDIVFDASMLRVSYFGSRFVFSSVIVDRGRMILPVTRKCKVRYSLSDP